MHQLDRHSVPAPACITPNDPARMYTDLRGPQKDEIRNRLHTMQQNRCAYCERRTGTGEKDGHIEHFRRRDVFTHLTTDWNNLFWSCNDPKFCGIHKDTCSVVGSTGKCRAVNIDHVINPCQDDPQHFLHFISDGSIQPRANLSAAEQLRFSETLRVFQLADAGLLVDSRRDAVKPYIDALNDLKDFGPEIVQAYINRKFPQINGVPFETAIRHFLQSNQP